MLDTGIDIPEIVNLVFFKPLRSCTKFWQMVGRGTRLCPDLFGPGQDKACFWIFDCCQNLEFFHGQGGSDRAAAPESLSARLFRARLAPVTGVDELITAADGDRSAELQPHRELLAESLRRHVAACPSNNFLVRPHLELVERFGQPGAWSQLDADARAMLRPAALHAAVGAAARRCRLSQAAGTGGFQPLPISQAHLDRLAMEHMASRSGALQEPRRLARPRSLISS
ncbi:MULTISPECIES: hypothetical protein [Aphanothece]|uniref:hypothetical protein n=1 Tax=Aphanothece TaxID=1121 RepID=UPI00398E4D40